MRHDTGRPQDRADAAELRRRSDLPEGVGDLPVERYRSIAEVPPPPASSDDPAINLRRVLANSRLCVRLARTDAVRGVHHFATITEANAAPRRA